MINTETKTANIPLGILAVLVSTFLLYLNHISPGIEGGMDSYNHYLIAKYSWQYPSLLLDQWGKPLYTLVSSPFAQLGINGMVVFNIICLIFTSFLAYRVALALHVNNAYLVFIFTILSPIFLDNTISSLTEPFSALLVLLSFYWIIKDKVYLGAIVAGFLPYARSEGYIILFIVAVYLVFYLKNFRSILYFLLGSIFFNLVGWLVTSEPLWVITQNPYLNFELSGKNICGSGGLFHYILAGHYTFGIVVCVLMVVGVIGFTGKLLTTRNDQNPKIGIIIFSFVLYFATHSIIWWQGMMGSCGYIRVMTVIAPLSGIIAVYGLNSLFTFLKSKTTFIPNTLFSVVIVIIVLNTVYVPFRYYTYKYPLGISQEQQKYEELLLWYNGQNYADNTSFYFYQYFTIIADLNPYDKTKHIDLWATNMQYAKKGDVLIWDSHFGPNECGIPLIELQQDTTWYNVKSIVPTTPIPTVNGVNFEIHVFEKM